MENSDEAVEKMPVIFINALSWIPPVFTQKFFGKNFYSILGTTNLNTKHTGLEV